MQNLKKIIEPLKWELIEELTWTGCPSSEDLKKAEDFGRRFAESVKAG
jgi:hypothetical protein